MILLYIEVWLIYSVAFQVYSRVIHLFIYMYTFSNSFPI